MSRVEVNVESCTTGYIVTGRIDGIVVRSRKFSTSGFTPRGVDSTFVRAGTFATDLRAELEARANPVTLTVADLTNLRTLLCFADSKDNALSPTWKTHTEQLMVKLGKLRDQLEGK